jgi:diguanylate cyclase (GGDEF)-like protein
MYYSVVSGSAISFVISFIIAGLLIGNRSMFVCMVVGLITHLGIIFFVHEPSIMYFAMEILLDSSDFLAIYVILWISISIQQFALKKSKEDSLTGLNNRSFFDAELIRLDNGRQFPITILYADVNNLKLVNDQLGHIAGDLILQKAGELMREALRNDDILCRLGGDEYGMICIKTNEQTADLIKQRIQEKIDYYNQSSGQVPIQVAVGTATTDTPGSLVEAFRLADDRMYLDKMEKKKRQRESTSQNGLVADYSKKP